MTYTYDILLNFSSKLLFFYEWERHDNIEHIKKIPLIRVDSNTINDIYENKIKVEEKFLDLIDNKCEKFDFKKIKYACLFADNNHIIAVLFNRSGESINKSRLMLDDETEILEYVVKLDEEKINYNVVGNNLEINYLTRKELKIKNYLLKELDCCYLKKDESKIKYLYLEYFNKESRDLGKMYNKLRSSVTKNDSNKNNKLYEVLLLESGKRLV